MSAHKHITHAGTEHAAATLVPEVGAHDHAQGSAEATVTLVEYGDYQCAHCGRAFPLVQKLQKRLGERLRFVFRNFPLNEAHPEALHAAEAAESVAVHSGEEAFWAMHDAIYTHQQDSEYALDDKHLMKYAADVGADPTTIGSDLEKEVHQKRVKADFMSGVRSGVNGTPTFFINGVRFDGNWSDIDAFEAALS
ncbi:MAG: thioredoxin domain-containing protein [Gemmatimonadaceae bacterium]